MTKYGIIMKWDVSANAGTVKRLVFHYSGYLNHNNFKPRDIQMGTGRQSVKRKGKREADEHHALAM